MDITDDGDQKSYSLFHCNNYQYTPTQTIHGMFWLSY